MLQVTCITFGTLKIAQTCSCLLCLITYITMGSRDYGGFYSDISMMFTYTMDCSSYGCGIGINICYTFYLKTSTQNRYKYQEV